MILAMRTIAVVCMLISNGIAWWTIRHLQRTCRRLAREKADLTVRLLMVKYFGCPFCLKQRVDDALAKTDQPQ